MIEDLLGMERLDCHKSVYLVICSISKSHFEDMDEDLKGGMYLLS
jgi:hypothetical protein